jgi:hypothetical protein
VSGYNDETAPSGAKVRLYKDLEGLNADAKALLVLRVGETVVEAGKWLAEFPPFDEERFNELKEEVANLFKLTAYDPDAANTINAVLNLVKNGLKVNMAVKVTRGKEPKGLGGAAEGYVNTRVVMGAKGEGLSGAPAVSGMSAVTPGGPVTQHLYRGKTSPVMPHSLVVAPKPPKDYAAAGQKDYKYFCSTPDNKLYATGQVHLKAALFEHPSTLDFAATVLIHEATHRFANTKDESYGSQDAQPPTLKNANLSKDDCLRNADSYALLIKSFIRKRKGTFSTWTASVPAVSNSNVPPTA